MKSNKNPWQSLSIREKSDMMKVAIRHGLTDLNDIRNAYNKFADGGGVDPGPGKKVFGNIFNPTNIEKLRYINGVNYEEGALLDAYAKVANVVHSKPEDEMNKGSYNPSDWMTNDYGIVNNVLSDSEPVITGQAPALLNTYYPGPGNKYPFTGHSQLFIPVSPGLLRAYEQPETNLNEQAYVKVDKTMKSPSYDLLSANCADAVNKYLGYPERSGLLEPWTLKSYVEGSHGGKSEKQNIYDKKVGMDRTLIPMTREDEYRAMDLWNKDNDIETSDIVYLRTNMKNLDYDVRGNVKKVPHLNGVLDKNRRFGDGKYRYLDSTLALPDYRKHRLYPLVDGLIGAPNNLSIFNKKSHGGNLFAGGGPEETTPVENTFLYNPEKSDQYLTSWSMPYNWNYKNAVVSNVGWMPSYQRNNGTWVNQFGEAVGYPEGVSSDGVPDTSWHEDWLGNRQQQLKNNMNATAYPGNTYNDADVFNMFKDEINNLKSYREYIPAPGTRYWKEGLAGITEPGPREINYNPEDEEFIHHPSALIVHERTHGLDNPEAGIRGRHIPQLNMIDSIMHDKYGKDWIYDKNYTGNGGDTYTDDPSEIYSRIMSIRHDAGLNPNAVLDADDIEKLKGDPRVTDYDKDRTLFRYDTDTLLRIFNEVAQNDYGNDNNFAAYGGYLSNDPGFFLRENLTY